ncbi:MAG: sugar phosphate nucleotidyltransferase [Candidatus Marisimplicoccus sp.]
MDKIHLLILAAGLSSRMKLSDSDDKMSESLVSQANTRSKGFIEIQSGNPLIYYIIKNAMAAGISSYYIILSKDSDDFKTYLDKISQELKIQIKIAYQDFYGNKKPLGTADAISQAQDQYKELQTSRFLVCNSDNLYSKNSFKTLIDSKDHCSMIAYKFKCLNFENERLKGFAILDIVDSFLNKIIEKPDQETIDLFNSKGIFVSMNIFSFFGNQVYTFFKDCPLNPIRNEKEIAVALQNMMTSTNNKIKVHELCEEVPDMTYKKDISKMSDYIEKNK